MPMGAFVGGASVLEQRGIHAAIEISLCDISLTYLMYRCSEIVMSCNHEQRMRCDRIDAGFAVPVMMA